MYVVSCDYITVYFLKFKEIQLVLKTNDHFFKKNLYIYTLYIEILNTTDGKKKCVLMIYRSSNVIIIRILKWNSK